MENFNWWIVYWLILTILNFVAFVISTGSGDTFGACLSAFMILFCGLILNENLNKKEKS
jgi:uncharacterized membrane protein YjjP (DUF1212 family)